jgi:hypothetical protein
MTTPVTPAQVEAAKALIQEEALTRWQHWRNWITLNKDRLELRKERERTDAGFDRDDESQKNKLEEIQRRLDAIPSELHTDFQAAFNEKRDEISDTEQGAGGVPRDIDEIELAVFKRLLVICDGDATTRGQVPYQGSWFHFDTSALNKVPTAAHYATGTRSQRRPTWQQLAGIAVIVLACIVFASQFLPGNSVAVDAGEAQQLLINGEAATTWSPISLAVQGADLSLPIHSTSRASWPRAGEGAAGWREGSIWPLELCVAGEALPEAAAQVQIASEGTGLIRTYQLADDQQQLSAPTSLIISACDDAKQLRYGALTTSVPQPAAAVGEAQTLTTNPAITLVEATVTGHAEAAEVPDGKVRVTLLVDTDAPIADWTPLKPSLQLASGEPVGPMSDPVVAPSGRTTLRYLVDTYALQSSASWQVSDSDSGAAIRWRLTLPPPPSRLAYLDQHLQVELPRVSRLASGQVRLEIPVTSDAPLTLLREDLAARQGTAVIPLPLFRQEDATLTPGKITKLTFDLLPPEQDQELTLTVGRSVFAIEIPEGR